MKPTEALVRLLAICFGTLFTLFCIVFSLRLFALKFPPSPSPLAQVPDLEQMVFSQGDSEKFPTHSLEGYKSEAFKSPGIYPMVEVRTTRDREWILYGPETLESQTTSTGALEQWDWNELKETKFKGTSFTLVRLEDFLKTINPTHLMIFVHNKEVAGAKSLARLLGDRDEPMLTLVHSPAHRMNRELRKQRPLWYFGADTSHLTQWNLFSAFWLESWASLDFEWAFQNSHLPKGSRLYSEMVHRKVPLLLDERIQSHKAEKEPSLATAQIILTNRPKNWIPKQKRND